MPSYLTLYRRQGTVARCCPGQDRIPGPPLNQDHKTERLIPRRCHRPDESMEIPEVRTWVIFYLLSFVVLLVAICITTQDDGRRWISLMLTLIVVGVNLFLLLSELKRHQARKTLMHEISKFGETRTEADPSGRRR